MRLSGQAHWHRQPGRPHAAVVGAGVAGLTAAYLLQRRYDVTLYEAQDRLGGHAHTHDVTTAGGRALALDSGFLVHNTHTYPHLVRLFGELGVSHPGHRDEHVGALRGLRAGVRGHARPAWAVSHRRARPPGRSTWPPWPPSRASTGTHGRLLASPAPESAPTLGEFLRRGSYSPLLRQSFRHPAGGRRLVMPARRRAGLPGPVPVSVPGPPRDAAPGPLARVAHRHRRLARVRGPGRQAAHHRHRRAAGAGHPPGGRRGGHPRPGRRHPPLRPGRGRHPPR